MPTLPSVASFSRILNIVKELSILEPPDAKERYPSFPTFAAHVSRLFQEDRLFDIIPRLEVEMRLVQEYEPPVRPAVDPYVSTQIGVFSKNFSDWEIGRFLWYPDCCIRPFAEEARYGLDERHAGELVKEPGKIFVTTAGFIPHSVHCQESLDKGLVAFVSKKELQSLRKLEAEIFSALPHMHPDYRAQYYEVRAP